MVIYGIIGIILVAVDQFIKLWVSNNVAVNTGIVNFIPGFIHITNIRNYGMAFGLFSGASWLRLVLLVLLIAFTALAVFAIVKKYIRTGFARFSAVLLLAGLISNGIDRAIFGYVTDMFEFEFIKFAIFNLADMAVLFGIILFAVAAFTGGLAGDEDEDDYDEDDDDDDDEEEEELPRHRTAPRSAVAETTTHGTTAPSPVRRRDAGNGVPVQRKRVIDETTVLVPERTSTTRPAATPTRTTTAHPAASATAAAPARPAPTAAQRPASTASARPAASTAPRTAARPASTGTEPTRAEVAAHNESTVRTVARPAASTDRTAAPAKEAPKAAPAEEEFDLESILAEFK